MKRRLFYRVKTEKGNTEMGSEDRDVNAPSKENTHSIKLKCENPKIQFTYPPT